jgi:SOS response regulatory protein OraA/RecX
MLLFWNKKRLRQELIEYGYADELINDALDRIDAEKEITIH